MVKIENLYKTFDKDGIRNINMEIEDGSVMTIIGRSGSGKTLLLKLILGLDKPLSGRILIDDIDIFKVKYKKLKKIRRKIGVLFQNNALFDSMNVYENVAIPLIHSDKLYSKKEIDEKVHEMLSLVSLFGIEKRYVNELSGGMQKRVAIARALINNPEFIVYDEPITGLDPITAQSIIKLIEKLCREFKKTSIIVTHDLRGFINFTDSISLIDNGNLLFTGKKEEFINFDNQVAKSYLSLAGCK